MDPGKLKAESDHPRALTPAEADEGGSLSWSIRRLIELVDEAIDLSGAQLARSAGLWADSPTWFGERDRSSRRHASDSASAQSMLEERDRAHRIDLT